MNAIARFLDWLYDDERGYIEVVAGRANPSDPAKIKLAMRTRRWCATRAAAVAYIGKLARHYDDIYVSERLYDERAKVENTRKEEYTRPSRIIFIDDAPEEPYLFYSLCVRTSEHSRHAYYKADAPTTKDDVRRATKYLGGDPSGIDLTQLVRVPGTFNTKNGGRWPVEVEDTGPVYKLDDLRSKFPQVEAPRGSGQITPLDWPEVESHLSNINALLTSARAQLIKPTTQTGRILGGEMLTFIVKGRPDDSRSMNACAVASGLLLRGFMDDEIAAVLIHLYRQWGSERDKGTAWCKLDAGRCINYAHEHHPEASGRQSPTRYRKRAQAEAIADVRPISRARPDRPQRFTAAALYLEYQQRPDLCSLKRKARASALNISTATLDRLEDALERDKLIAIETDEHRQGSRVILQGVIIIAPHEVLSDAPETPAPEAPSIRAESEQIALETPQCIGETHPPPNTPPPAAPVERAELVGWVAAAFDQLAEAGARLSFARVRKYVLSDADGRPFQMPALARLYRDELKRRQWARQDAREERRARSMTRAALVKKSRAIASQAADLRRRNSPQAPIWTRRAGIYAAEEARRDALEAQRILDSGYTLVEQRALLDQVDGVRLDLRRERSGRAARLPGGCVPPLPAAAPIDPSGIIGRLKQQRDERIGASGYD